MTIYLVISVILAAGICAMRKRAAIDVLSGVFYIAQALFFFWLLKSRWGVTMLGFFTFDGTAILFTGLLVVVSPVVWMHSVRYLKEESVFEYKVYHTLMILLCVAIAGVYSSNNLAVNWIMLEATTLCTAGLVYHRRTERSLEATWKYIFVCSTGIAIAYLGVLLMSSVAVGGNLSYAHLRAAIDTANPLYMKLAFVFILVGYSSKMEVFPLYTVGVDANHVMPSPASGLVSTALVNAGFVSIFRVYAIVAQSGIAAWASNVLIITGVLSVLFGAFFLRRTNNYKRLLSYSTVENMGLVLIGIGVGGVALWAALLHVVGHTFIKSAMFMQLSHIGRIYGTYRINRIGDYLRADRFGAVAIFVGALMLAAFPPSPLFVSEITIFGEIIATGRWWLIVIVVLLICVVIYSLLGHVVDMCFKTSKASVDLSQRSNWLTLAVVAFLAVAIMLYRQPFVAELFNEIVSGV